MNDYDDIIDLPYPMSTHTRMPQSARAAQFAPFAALSGHNEAIAEAETINLEEWRRADAGEP